MTGIGAIAVAVAVALVILSSALHEADIELAGATERVRLLMDLESYALQQVRGTVGSETQPASDIIGRLRQTPDAKIREPFSRLEAMIISINAASTAAERESGLEALVRELRSVVAREDENARRAMAASASMNRLANAAGITAIVILIAGIAGVLAWLWRSALGPLVMMIDAIQRYARGDRGARAPEDGPTEIRQIAAAFNDMAVTLGRQREEQLAFIGGVAHDLRTPLNALQVGMALLDHPSSDAARVRERIQRQIGWLQQMIGDLLDRTRIEAGQFELHLEDCDLRDLLARVVDVQRDSVPMRGFRLLLPAEPVWIRCDPLRIDQVMNNLLGNAVKYSPESSDIDIVLEHADSTAVISVTDRGIGMTAADQSQVFEPFRRGRNVGNIGGSGLGLSVTWKIVEAHGGSIDVRSEPGSGSVFRVRLPCVPVTGVAHERSDRSVESASLPHDESVTK
jgi:signal transduction histidine kinase